MITQPESTKESTICPSLRQIKIFFDFASAWITAEKYRQTRIWIPGLSIFDPVLFFPDVADGTAPPVFGTGIFAKAQTTFPRLRRGNVETVPVSPGQGEYITPSGTALFRGAPECAYLRFGMWIAFLSAASALSRTASATVGWQWMVSVNSSSVASSLMARAASSMSSVALGARM